MIAWPKLLGLGLGLFATGFVMVTAGDVLRFGFFGGIAFVRAGLPFILSSVLLILSYALYRAHNWARLTLFGIVLIAFIAAAWMLVSDVTHQHLAVDGDASKITPEELREINREEFMLRVASAGTALMVLAPLAWLLFVLLHADVVNAFRRPESPRDAIES